MSDSNEAMNSVPPPDAGNAAPSEQPNRVSSDSQVAKAGSITSKRVVIPRTARRAARHEPVPPPVQETSEAAAPAELETPTVSPETETVAPPPPESTSAESAAAAAITPAILAETAAASETPGASAPPAPTEAEPPAPAPFYNTPPADAAPILPLTQSQLAAICPYLGIAADPGSRFSSPSQSHRCYSPKRPGPVSVEYQAEYCFSAKHTTCDRFVPLQASPNPVVAVAPAMAVSKPSVDPLIAPAEVPVAESPKRRGRGLELLLWVIAAILLVGALIAVLPMFVPGGISGILGGGSSTASNPSAPTASAAIALSTATQAPTETVLPTGAPTLTPAPTLAPLVVPTPPEDGLSVNLLPLGSLTGWSATDELQPHWGDARLIAGNSNGTSYSSILQFDLANLPQGTQVLFGALELTGRESGKIQPDSSWQVEIVEPLKPEDWVQKSSEEAQDVPALGTLGEPIKASEVGPGVVNRIMLSDTDRQLLAQQFASGRLALRIRNTDPNNDSSFSWEAGGSSNSLDAPQLHLVVVPGQYVIVTNTPVPTNVLTAAANVVRGTDQARRLGTPTPFPPGVATATPGGEIILVDSSTAVPDNRQTEIARAVLATAVAVTTGTYTPTPPGVVVVFPTNTPVIVGPERLTTPTPIPQGADLLQVQLPPEMHGMILARSTYFGDEPPGAPILINPNLPTTSPEANIVGRFTGKIFYNAAAYREQFSPDRTKQLIYPNDSDGIQQVGYQDLNTGEVVILTHFNKGIAYDAAWSPDGGNIVFVSTNLNNTDEIYVLTLGDKNPRCLTCGTVDPRLQPNSQRPTFSPDGTQIAFWSSRGGAPQIWVMNVDGTNLVDISGSRTAEKDPVWVK